MGVYGVLYMFVLWFFSCFFVYGTMFVRYTLVCSSTFLVCSVYHYVLFFLYLLSSSTTLSLSSVASFFPVLCFASFSFYIYCIRAHLFSHSFSTRLSFGFGVANISACGSLLMPPSSFPPSRGSLR